MTTLVQYKPMHYENVHVYYQWQTWKHCQSGCIAHISLLTLWASDQKLICKFEGPKLHVHHSKIKIVILAKFLVTTVAWLSFMLLQLRDYHSCTNPKNLVLVKLGGKFNISSRYMNPFTSICVVKDSHALL